MDKIINCISIAKQVDALTLSEIQKLDKKSVKPLFATIFVGDNAESLLYINNKRKRAEQLGITSEFYHFASDIPKLKLIKLIESLNYRHDVHGIFLQLPVPFEQKDTVEILNTIDKDKDIDGLSATNLGYLIQGYKHGFVPCGVMACISVLEALAIDLQGKVIVILGVSLLIGAPLIHILLHSKATVYTAHKYTKNLKELTQQADILIVAIGSANFIDQGYIQKNVIILDVGISVCYIGNKKLLKGDVKLESVIDTVSFITPNPNGIGRITVAYLMSNIIKSVMLNSRVH